MEEAIKNRFILILAILAIMFFVGTIRSCDTAKRLTATQLELDKERTTGWDLEQKNSELKKEKVALEKKLEEANFAYEGIKKALSQEQLVNQSLKEELDKLNKLKERLEENLKEALFEAKSGKSKK